MSNLSADECDFYGKGYWQPSFDDVEDEHKDQACDNCAYCYRLVKSETKQSLACAYELMWDEVGARVYEVLTDEWCENYEHEYEVANDEQN